MKTIHIDDSTGKGKALLKYLLTLDFVELSKTSDWWDEIGTENKASIKRGLDDIKHERTHNDDDVRNSVRERILKAKKG